MLNKMNKNINEKQKRRDDYHLGHFIVDYMRKGMNDVCQIDAATGQEETSASMLSRSIRLAQSFGRLGLVPGDPILVAGRGHLDVHIPFYAGMMSGLPVAGIDPALKRSELKCFLNTVKPKIAFCEYTKLEEYQNVVHELNLDLRIVTFGGNEHSFSKLMETYQDLDEDEFQVATFDVDKMYCWLISTSGTTGQPKVVALTHAHILQFVDEIKPSEACTKPGVRKTALNMSSLHWISGCYIALLMPMNYIKVQTSASVTTEHVIDVINKYKPVDTLCTPTLLEPILHHEKHCDLTCFDILRIGGSKIRSRFLTGLRARTRADTIIYKTYGLTETGGMIVGSFSEKPYGSTGTLHPKYEAKLISPETGKEILELNIVGELCVRGPIMACYYNDPKETESAFMDDGYFKTGDLFYKDEHGYYHFVERLKLLLKYRNYQIIPLEVEDVILRHPGVADVCVTGVPHADDGEHVVACVVRRPGHHVTADDIKELVARHFSASKHLHGGVLFLDALPTTPSGKVARLHVKTLALTTQRE